MALEIAAVPVLTGEASDRFDQMMEQSEERRGSVDFSREISEARAILSKANFWSPLRRMSFLQDKCSFGFYNREKTDAGTARARQHGVWDDEDDWDE